MKQDLRQVVGSLLIVGLGGTELTPLERAWLRLIRPAGIILFRRNIADRVQTRALLEESTGLCASRCGAFVDVEGGVVNRLRDALAVIPSTQAVAEAARAAGRPALAREHGELIARAVKAFGFNSSFAPVLDLALPESRKVMASRSAGDNAAEVVAYALEFFAGLAAQGVAGCGKHFPGLGGGALDSHLDTPKIERAWKQLWREDMEPYRALGAAMPMVMVNHAAYPQSADPARPASVSKFWMQTVLCKRIGFRGLVLSDDLEMGGVANFMPIPEAAVATVRAGAELAMICHHAEPILEAYEALLREGERSATFRRIVLERARTSARKRASIFPEKMPPTLGAKQFEALRARILRFGETVAKTAARGAA